MKNDRRLALRRDTLADLTQDEMSFGAGQGEPTTDIAKQLLLKLTLHAYCSWSCTGPAA